jgi:hypothetical protein
MLSFPSQVRPHVIKRHTDENSPKVGINEDATKAERRLQDDREHATSPQSLMAIDVHPTTYEGAGAIGTKEQASVRRTVAREDAEISAILNPRFNLVSVDKEVNN